MTDLYIIAAGTGSRMGGQIPKALVRITDKPCLTTTLQQAHGKFSKIFIVTNELAAEAWDEYFRALTREYPELAQGVYQVPIRSGLGDGHATLAALESASTALDLWGQAREGELGDDVVIAWGDVFFQHSQTFDEILSADMPGQGIVPVAMEFSPYVALLTDDHGACRAALFSKYGEQPEQGWHDQSIFRFKRTALHAALVGLNQALYKAGKYVAPGGELSLLYVFHYMYNVGQQVHTLETQWPTMSFNTPLEVAGIQREIDHAWTGKFRN